MFRPRILDVLFFAILSSAVAAPTWAEELPLWPLPSTMHTSPVAQKMQLNGVPLRAALLSGQISDYEFRRALEASCAEEKGRFQALQFGAKNLWSCIREPYSQTVQWQEENGRITGELSTLRLDSQPTLPPPLLLIPDRTESVSDLETEDDGVRGRVQILRSDLSVPQLRAALLRAAQAKGWKVEPLLSGNLMRLSLRQRHESLDLAFQPERMGGCKTVLVWQSKE
ncbi:hypothetical protein [Acidithiobacillus sp. AMEEHan]|uniref:hypothetical protein n=1 Tax=Acidithiobacillus sp. AMEEHan TaxID=2994951 RepID=UPI0027E460C4|nr:hypothetical protein [Acidithiobacillus sp. AMEEHan]